MIELSAHGPDDWQLWKQLRLYALRDSPGAFGAKLSEWRSRAEQRWRERLRSVPCNVVARLDGVPAGMVSGVAPDERGTVDLISMWVAPFARGRGLGDALVAAVVAWAREQGAARVELAVREENAHAIALYERNGFTDAGSNPQSDSAEPPERLMRLTL